MRIILDHPPKTLRHKINESLEDSILLYTIVQYVKKKKTKYRY